MSQSISVHLMITLMFQLLTTNNFTRAKLATDLIGGGCLALTAFEVFTLCYTKASFPQKNLQGVAACSLI